MKSKTNKKTLNKIKKRNNTRRKRGGGENEILNYLFNLPSHKNTREFEKKFSEYIEEIIELQENSKTLSKQKEKDENSKELNNVKNELITYIKQLPDNIDKKVIVNPANTERTIFGPPISIVANLIENKGQRREILDSLKNKKFAYDETKLNEIIDRVDKSRSEEKENERRIKEAIKTKMKEEKKKEAENVVIEEVKPKTVFTVIDDIDEGRQEKKHAAEHAKKIQRQKETEWEEDQQKIRDELKANAERIRREQEKKEDKKRQTMEKNIKAIQEQKKSNPTRELLPLNVTRIEPTKTERKEQNINIENVAKAEQNEDYLKELLDNNETTDIVIKTQELSEEKPIKLPEEIKEMEKKPIEKTITTSIIKHDPYDIRTIPEYWRTYFPNDELYILRDYMLSILNNLPLLYKITSDFFPSFRIETRNNKYINNLANDPNVNTNIIPYIEKYDTHIRFILLFIGIMSNILKDKCDIVIKGGKAIQMKCLIPYESNDIDILIVSNKINKREIALEMSKLLIWIVSQQQIIHNMSMIEIDKAEPIIKLSIYTNYGFEAVVDIGFNEPKDEIKSYIYSNLRETDTRHLHFNYVTNNMLPALVIYPIFFISESVEGMIKEKMYYFLKYVILKKYTPEDNVEIFIPKIYKSLRTLFMCINAKKTQIADIINTVINEKSDYLDGITTKNIEEIADELIKNIQ